MMRDEATKNFTEGKTTAEWTEGTEAQFRFYLEKPRSKSWRYSPTKKDKRNTAGLGLW